MSFRNLSLLILLHIISCKVVYSQFWSCDCPHSSKYLQGLEIDSLEYLHTVNDDTINGLIPQNHQYTGLVVEYKKAYQTVRLIKVTEDENGKEVRSDIYRPFADYFKKSKGNYIKGKKTGLFSFFEGNEDECYSYTIEYRRDSIIKRPFVCNVYKFSCSTDSSFCKGRIKTMYEYEINYVCKNSKCTFYQKGVKQIVLECDQKELENTLDGFYYGIFDREIRKALLIEQKIKQKEINN